MGQNCFKQKRAVVDAEVEEAEPEYDRDKSEVVRAILIASDYAQTDTPLDCVRFNGVQMQQLVQRSGVTEVYTLFQNDITKRKITDTLQSVGSQCGPDDTLFIYFLGHGDYQDDQDGDEADGQDEVLCLVGEDPSQWDYMSDDEWSELITSSVPAETRILIVTDCCHSGSMADMARPCWKGREVINITGCADDQTSMDTGSGSFMTNCLIKAIGNFESEGTTDYSVAQLYNAMLTVFDEDVRPSLESMGLNQSIGIECPADFNYNMMPWPLVPKQ